MFKKGSNPHHPKIGQSTRTEPIRNKHDIAEIKSYLAGRPRELLLFTLGINTAWRVNDLLSTTVEELRYLSPISLEWVKKESKTGKIRRVTANRVILETLREVSKKGLFDGKDDKSLVFTGLRGTITQPTVTTWVKEWTDAIGLRGDFGGRSLRQTWVYHCIKDNTADIATLMQMLGHSSQLITLRYACIQPEDHKKVYLATEL